MTEITLFTYAGLTPDVATEVRGAAERIRVRMKRTVEDIIAIGLDLIAVKEKLPHGSFLPWIEAEFGMAGQTARRFMQVAEAYGNKSNIMLNLPPTVLYELAAPSTPDAVRSAVEEKAESGEAVTIEDVKRLKREITATAARADKAEQDSQRYKSQAETLLDNQKQLISDAEERVRQQTTQQIADAKKEAETIRKTLNDENLKLRRLADDVREAALAEARGKAEALAEEELAKRRDALRQAESELEKVKGDVDRRHQALKGIEHSISEKQALADRLNSVDYETREILKEADEIIRLQALFMVTLSDIERANDHPEKVRQAVAKLAGQCADLSTILSSFYDGPRPTVNRVINGDVR